MIGVHLVGDWKLAKKVLNTAPAAFDRALKKTIKAEAERLAGMIRKNITSNTPPPNATSTIQDKGSSKTLVNTGMMLQSVQIVWRGKFEAFVGLPARARGGVSNLADIHENGRVIIQQMTDKQRRFLHAKFGGSGGGGGGTGIIVIHIPARPFVRPAVEEFQKGGPEAFLKVLGQNLEPWAKGQ